MKNKLIGILGGTFDPVHHGHLQIAHQLQENLNFQEVRFIPCQQPVFDKTTLANTQQRLAMLQLAIKNQAKFIIDERELKRSTPSYTVDTLISLREELGDASLCLIIGSDTLKDLTRWSRWEKLIQLAHLIVVPRPGHPLPTQGAVAELIAQHKIDDSKLLSKNPMGYLFIANIMPPTISATEIRKQIASGLNPHHLLPDNVWNYIQHEKLYV